MSEYHTLIAHKMKSFKDIFKISFKIFPKKGFTKSCFNTPVSRLMLSCDGGKFSANALTLVGQS